MTEATATERPPSPDTSAHVRLSPRWLSTAVYGGVTVLCALAGYWLMFGQFAVYDDEGFFDYSLHLFATGHPLYTQVFSDYGPFYYAVFGGFFALIGHSVTTDAGRLIQLVLWIATTLAMGLIAHRLSGRLAIGAAALATTFALLTGATSEPMHASMLNDVLLTLIVAVAVFGIERHTTVALAAIGVLAGALLLTKINVGGYAVIAIAFSVVMAGGWLGQFRWLRAVVALVLVLVGPVVMIGKLDLGWAENYALLSALSAAALVLAARPARRDPADDDGTRAWALPLISGFLALLVLVIAIVVALGTHPGDLVRDIVTVPSHQGSVLVVPITLGEQVVWWSLALCGVAWLWSVRAGVRHGTGVSLWDGGLRLLAGIVILLSLGDQTIFTVAPNAAFSLAMPLAWVAALPSSREASTPEARLRRLLLPSLAVTGALVAYPVAGTQIGYGSVLFVPCAAVCLADGWSGVSAWSAARSTFGVPEATRRGLAGLLAVLAAGCVWQFVIQSLSMNHATYSANVALTIPGATRLKLPVGQAQAIETIVGAIGAHHCRTLIGYPGMYSFDGWTGLPYVSPETGEQPYWRLLSYEQEYSVLKRAQKTPGLCAIQNDGLAATYGGHPETSPIVKYIAADFTPVATASPYELEVRRRPARHPG